MVVQTGDRVTLSPPVLLRNVLVSDSMGTSQYRTTLTDVLVSSAVKIDRQWLWWGELFNFSLHLADKGRVEVLGYSSSPREESLNSVTWSIAAGRNIPYDMLNGRSQDRMRGYYSEDFASEMFSSTLLSDYPESLTQTIQDASKVWGWSLDIHYSWINLWYLAGEVYLSPDDIKEITKMWDSVKVYKVKDLSADYTFWGLALEDECDKCIPDNFTGWASDWYDASRNTAPDSDGVVNAQVRWAWCKEPNSEHRYQTLMKRWPIHVSLP